MNNLYLAMIFAAASMMIIFLTNGYYYMRISSYTKSVLLLFNLTAKSRRYALEGRTELKELADSLQWFMPYMDAEESLDSLDGKTLFKLAFKNITAQTRNEFEALLKTMPKNMRKDVENMYVYICLCGCSSSFISFLFLIFFQIPRLFLKGTTGRYGRKKSQSRSTSSIWEKVTIRPSMAFSIMRYI